jgi:hypothetical protein
MSQPPTKLERRARALLRAYPAEYRRDRAEEMIGTLLEAAPAGRSFPTARDAWALIAGGRHARAARNRSLGARASLRLALTLGVSIFVSSTTATEFASAPARWLTVTGIALGALAALAPWLGSRKATAVLVVPAGALVVYELAPSLSNREPVVSLAVQLIALGSLVALSGGSPTLPRSWSLLPCAIPAAVAAGHASFSMQDRLSLDALLLLAAVAVCWLVTDARPAFGISVGYSLSVLQLMLLELAFPESRDLQIANLMTFLLRLAIAAPVLLPATWLLYRQAAASRRPLPKR